MGKTTHYSYDLISFLTSATHWDLLTAETNWNLQEKKKQHPHTFNGLRGKRSLFSESLFTEGAAIKRRRKKKKKSSRYREVSSAVQSFWLHCPVDFSFGRCGNCWAFLNRTTATIKVMVCTKRAHATSLYSCYFGPSFLLT